MDLYFPPLQEPCSTLFSAPYANLERIYSGKSDRLRFFHNFVVGLVLTVVSVATAEFFAISTQVPHSFFPYNRCKVTFEPPGQSFEFFSPTHTNVTITGICMLEMLPDFGARASRSHINISRAFESQQRKFVSPSVGMSRPPAQK
ncbi:hypothetical protein Y032_0724g1851 [Ancylostoma ceylanicum]|uniref:Uncharacterized protein n=1 Tax=Ancylostoma ceylanicum TaxID=53326 RepID=A0A016WFB8_9BILA|nr:hypothetical protein Y032_0724g1851 [Ancylostoma ceylanicum]